MPLLGRPIIAYTLETLRRCAEIDELIVMVAPAEVERARRTLVQAGGRLTEKVIAGGATRPDSVRAGLAEAHPASDFILIHDGARPFFTPELVHRLLAAAAEHGAALAALPATDTLKTVDAEAWVEGTLERARVWQVQTPQAFRRSLLEAAHRAAAAEGVTATDDAALVERLGHRVKVVTGEGANFKITTPEDMTRAVAYLTQGKGEMSRRSETRTGIGFDAHRVAAGRRLILAGVEFPGEDGLLGHSDADVVCHALCDALLGASAAGDIGQLFPDTDPRYAGASSLALLTQVAQMVRARQWEIEHVDTVVVAEHPKLVPQVAAMRRALAGAMELLVERVSIKGKTTEGMGFTGRREGIACYAVCTLSRTNRNVEAETREASC